MIKIKNIIILLIVLITLGCNFLREEKITSSIANKFVLTPKIKSDSILLRNVTDSILHYLYPDSTKNFLNEEKNFFEVYKYSKNYKGFEIYPAVLKKIYDLNDSELNSRFKISQNDIVNKGINLMMRIYYDKSIKYNSLPGNQKILFLNENNNTVTLYLSDSAVVSTKKDMKIFINVRDKVFISKYEYDLNKQFYIKKSEDLFEEIE